MDEIFTTYSTEKLKNHLHVVVHLNYHNEFSDRIRAIQKELARRGNV